MRHIFLRSIIAESKDDLELSPREKAMIKWFVKYHLALVAIAVFWYQPFIALRTHIYEYRELKTAVARVEPAQAKEEAPVDATSTHQVVAQERSLEEEYNYLLETDASFRSYISNMRVPNNNPGNLVFARQPEATKVGRFASFPDSRTGFRALLKQLELDSSRKHTVTTFFHKFSPPSENNTASLISGAEKILSVSKDTALADINIISLAKYIAFREHSYK